ncbi:hypothetical protein DIPPA_20464 [Diplonema papillatum]|nr:hypothetical protein DIPPA_20464 [Diplonema papillatum]
MSFDDRVSVNSDDDSKPRVPVSLSSVSLFYLGQHNAASTNSMAVVPGTGNRPPLTFVAGASSIFVLAPAGQQSDDIEQSDFDWRQLELSGLHCTQIIGIATVANNNRAVDSLWLLVAYLTALTEPRRQHIAVVRIERGDPRLPGVVKHQETIDWYPLLIKSYHFAEHSSRGHSSFLLSGSDGVIHVRMVASNYFYEVAVVNISQVAFLRHLTEVRSVVLSLDYVSRKEYDLWATGTQDGWLQLWMIPEQKTVAASALLNGPISSVAFFTVASQTRRDKSTKKPHDEIALASARAEARFGRGDHEDWYFCHNLVVAEAGGRVIIFWNVEKHGLHLSEALPNVPLNHDVAGSPPPAQGCKPGNPATDDKSPDAPTLLTPLRRGASSPALKPSSSAMELFSINELSIGSSPDRRLGTPLRHTPRRNSSHIQPDGGLLGTGVLCVHPTDSTGDGVTELMVGTYAKGMVVYKLHCSPSNAASSRHTSSGRQPEFASPFIPSEPSTDVKSSMRSFQIDPAETGKGTKSSRPSWRYEVGYVRWFPYAVHAIFTLTPRMEAARELQVLTAFHLHIIGPDANELRQRVRQRLALIQQIAQLEKQLGGKADVADMAKSDDRLPHACETVDSDDNSTASTDTESDGAEPPVWVIDRFQYGF